jgi:hypothetical protein
MGKKRCKAATTAAMAWFCRWGVGGSGDGAATVGGASRGASTMQRASTVPPRCPDTNLTSGEQKQVW